MLRKLLAVVVAVLMLAGMAAPAGADPFEDGLDAFNAADYAQAYAIWWRLAKEGDAKAQASLGFMYYSGKGVHRDDEQSLYWFRRAADAGQPTAQFFLECNTSTAAASLATSRKPILGATSLSPTDIRKVSRVATRSG